MMLLFSDFLLVDLFEIFIWITGSFFIGFYFGYKRNNSKETTDSQNLFDSRKEINPIKTPTIRVRKTFDRGGIEHTTEESEGLENKILDEEGSTEDKHDDLKKNNDRGDFESNTAKEGDDLENKILEKKDSPEDKHDDDLKRINGIGNKLAQKLKSIGVVSFDKVSKLTDKEIKDLEIKLKYVPGRVKKDRWVEQAQELIEQDKKNS